MEVLAINRAFSKQSVHYDHDDRQNKVLQDMRSQVYQHVAKFLKPHSKILELNAGTGIDAVHFFREGHAVLATDLSDGMVRSIRQKIKDCGDPDTFECEQLSFDQLDKLLGNKFDYVFSNFGGLNCINNLDNVANKLSDVLRQGGYLTWVVMPPVSIWELLWVFKGHPKAALRRLHKNGVLAHLEGEYFTTYYHSLRNIVKALGPDFKLIANEGLCAVSPPPSGETFPVRRPWLYSALRKFDAVVRNFFPFNRCADHIIVTFQHVGTPKVPAILQTQSAGPILSGNDYR